MKFLHLDWLRHEFQSQTSILAWGFCCCCSYVLGAPELRNGYLIVHKSVDWGGNSQMSHFLTETQPLNFHLKIKINENLIALPDIRIKSAYLHQNELVLSGTYLAPFG